MASTQSTLVVRVVGAVVPLRIVLLVVLTAVWGLDGAAVAIALAELALGFGLAIACRRLSAPPTFGAITSVAAWGVAAGAAGLVASAAGAGPLAAGVALVVFAPRVVRTGRELLGALTT
jgi:hypothetical protein